MTNSQREALAIKLDTTIENLDATLHQIKQPILDVGYTSNGEIVTYSQPKDLYK